MKKIFISIPWFHPAFRAGGPVQSVANLVNEFTDDVQYRIFCGNTDLNNISLENIETGKWTDYNPYTKVWYAATGNRSSTLTGLVEKENPDVLFIIGIYSWHFNIVPLLFCKVPRKILSVRGMLHPGALTQKSLKKKLFLLLFKQWGIHRKISFHVTDELEKTYVQQCFGKDASIFIAGNFPRRFLRGKLVEKEINRLQLVSIALISPMKNHLLVLQGLQQCSAIIEYHICGPVKDMEYWQQCLAYIKKLPSNITVQFHGDIEPLQVEHYLHKGHVFILPSLSENFGHAIYEAFTAGKPVITSHHTPWQGLDEAQAGMNIELQVSAIKNAIGFFAGMNQEVYNEWSEGASRYGMAQLKTGSIKQQYKAMFF